MTEPEADLESFRQKWRDEVSNRQPKRRLSAGDLTRIIHPSTQFSTTSHVTPTSLAASHRIDTQPDEERYPITFHDLENPEDSKRLNSQHHKPRIEATEPTTALDHYEWAVEKEAAGSLGDSVSLYRKAYKLDSEVDKVYKSKHFPPNSFHKGHGKIQSTASEAPSSSVTNGQSIPTLPLAELIESFSGVSVLPTPPITDLSPASPCPIANLPEEILVLILQTVADDDVAILARLAQVCKRFAYLVSTEDRIWKRVVLGPKFGFGGMRFLYASDINWNPLQGAQKAVSRQGELLRSGLDLTPAVYPSYRSQFRHRPRIRFNGCYISAVNYPRPGASHQSQYSWNSPIHIVNYYRYLRFFRDGTAISLLTTSEPADVVHHITRENVHVHHSQGFPSAVMGSALKARWRLTGRRPAETSAEMESDFGKGPGQYRREPLHAPEGEGVEAEGTVHVESQGVTPKYLWIMRFKMGSAGRKEGTRNNKLAWRGFWSYNKLTDDFGEFGLKHDQPFYFSRVRSYNIDS